MQITDTDPAEEDAFSGYNESKNLTYDSARSPYSVYDYKSSADGVKSVRLYTDTGWSNLEIYQNYLPNSASGYAAYQDFQGKELSNGFGKTTYVIVQDERVFDVEIIKHDQSGNVLTGATLSVKQSGEEVLSEDEIAAIKTVGDKLLARDEILLNTVYVLSETAAPDGYIKLADTIAFKIVRDSAAKGGYKLVKEDGGAWDSASKLQLTVTTRHDDELNMDVDLIQLKVTNDTGAELPNTGGPGAQLYTWSGVTLVVLSALMYGFGLRRKRGKEVKE